MSRPKKKPTFDQNRILQEFMEAVADAFGEYDDRNITASDAHSELSHTPSLNAVAAEFHITALKARKLLITAGVYSTEASRTIQHLYSSHHSIPEIMVLTNLSRASVHSYLPYTKIPYNMGELSINAERTRVYRERNKKCSEFPAKIEGMKNTEQEAALWELMTNLQGCVFYTAKGLKFTYKVKGGELYVNRKEKSITRATVIMAFWKCQELEGMVTGPKKLGTFGASYLYPIFVRIGLVKAGRCKESCYSNN